VPQLAISLSNLGQHLSNLDRHEEALTATQEAVDIYRSLVQTRPDTFLPDLTTSLGALGKVLTAAGHHEDAATALREGLATIAPFVERDAQAFGDLARKLAVSYLAVCRKAGTEPDSALLERIAQALDGQTDS
jgi:tetratricopeptide (TPR) repeat protein